MKNPCIKIAKAIQSNKRSKIVKLIQKLGADEIETKIEVWEIAREKKHELISRLQNILSFYEDNEEEVLKSELDIMYKNSIPELYTIKAREDFENPNNGPYSTIATSVTIFKCKHIGEVEKSDTDRLQWAEMTFNVDGMLQRKVTEVKTFRNQQSIFEVTVKETVWQN